MMGLGLKALLSVGAMGAGGGRTRTVKVPLAETVSEPLVKVAVLT